MKKCKKLVIALFFAVFILNIFLLKELFAAEAKIAFVDLSVVFDEYTKTKDYDSQLEDSQDAKQKEIDKKVQAIKEMQDKLPLLAEKEKKNKQEEIDSKTRDLEGFRRDAENDLRKQRDERLKEVLEDIQKVVEDVAKQKGYDFILNERVLLYGNDSLDISKDILKMLNDNYKKKDK